MIDAANDFLAARDDPASGLGKDSAALNIGIDYRRRSRAIDGMRLVDGFIDGNGDGFVNRHHMSFIYNARIAAPVHE